MFRSSGGAASALAAEPGLDSLLPAFRDEGERGMLTQALQVSSTQDAQAAAWTLRSAMDGLLAQTAL